MSGDHVAYADYERLAAEYRQQCRDRREREAERNATPRAGKPKHTDIVTRTSGELVYKTNPNARVPAPEVAHSDGFAFNDHQIEILGMTVAEMRREMRAHVAAEIDSWKRELFVLREELRLEREVRALHDEIAAARAEVPKVPEIEARVEAKQSKLAAEQDRLERELTKTKDRISKMRVAQSQADYRFAQHLKQSEPAVELHFKTSETSFKVRDLSPAAAEDWREFCANLMSEQQQGAASLRVVDPTSSVGLAIGLPVRRKPGYAA